MRGRKPKRESRSSEIYASLVQWKQIPECSRPSLRSLAAELGTSHQLLSFYLRRLDKWQMQQYRRRAEQIRERAAAQNREMSTTEEYEVRALNSAAIRCLLDSAVEKNLSQIEEDAKAGRLKHLQIQFLLDQASNNDEFVLGDGEHSRAPPRCRTPSAAQAWIPSRKK